MRAGASNLAMTLDDVSHAKTPFHITHTNFENDALHTFETCAICFSVYCTVDSTANKTEFVRNQLAARRMANQTTKTACAPI